MQVAVYKYWHGREQVFLESLNIVIPVSHTTKEHKRGQVLQEKDILLHIYGVLLLKLEQCMVRKTPF